ncbi:MAG TPA: nuclear transport factor 2 family protein [Allosphingosinicella sp.]|nr:nuclear transport factor 2 family protein [Allosphingosinicella sp.]
MTALLAWASPAAAGEADSEPVAVAARAAAATVDAFHAALRAGDTEAAAALLADDALIFEEGGAERSKAEYAARHLAADAAFSKAVPGVRTRRRGDSAGGMAWIASEGRSKGRYRGTDVDRVTAETMVLRRSGEAWRIVHIHWSSAQSSVE